ncbi:hypothetical protein DL96DRAFT_263072 [Flagelloscypha sp. PMI_526]|nr:hypothetical protein DL96DRAFT_263072 [Flagelloscypha sp. PMI_526]
MAETREGGLKVLTFDGEADIRVGVLSALHSLLIMMRRVAYDHPELVVSHHKTGSSNVIPEALPCKCFDLIVGSGDGGWIAIMLGRLGMSTTQTIGSYLQIRSSVHDSYPYDGPLDCWQPDSKAAIFEALLQQLVMNQVDSENAHEMLQIPDPPCYVVALAMHYESDAPHAAYFRNYITRKDNLPNCPIWFAMRAVGSSTIFPAAQISSTAQRFLAASELNFNNPVNEAISEAISIAKVRKIMGPALACLVSLGAGHPGVEALNESNLAKTTIRLTQDAARAHEYALQRLKEAPNLSPETYYRLNVEQGLQKDLLCGITQGVVTTHTEMYLRRIEVDDALGRLIESLIRKPEFYEGRQQPESSILQTQLGQSNSHAEFTENIQDPTPESVLIKTYTTELYKLELGLPLWDPQPVQKVVEVGDLGFVNRNGGFETLFNITVEAHKQAYSVPRGFQPFYVPRQNFLIRERSISKPYLNSGVMELNIIENTSKLTFLFPPDLLLN